MFGGVGDHQLRGRGYIEPAGNVEYVLEQIVESMKRRGRGRRDIFDAAFLLTRYRTEFAMLDIPAPVQRFAVPVLLVMGRLLRRYTCYADAPEPVRR